MCPTARPVENHESDRKPLPQTSEEPLSQTSGEPLPQTSGEPLPQTSREPLPQTCLNCDKKDLNKVNVIMLFDL